MESYRPSAVVGGQLNTSWDGQEYGIRTDGSRIRVDDRKYLRLRPQIYEEFDYVVYTGGCTDDDEEEDQDEVSTVSGGEGCEIRYGYYCKLGLRSRIPRRELSVEEGVFELAFNMCQLQTGESNAVLDLTDSIFIVSDYNDLDDMARTLTQYSRWLRPDEVPFANDSLKYVIRQQVSEGKPTYLDVITSRRPNDLALLCAAKQLLPFLKQTI